MPYKEFCVFFSGKLFYKINRKLFSCICIAWYKHSRRWENSRQLCKPSTSSRICITVSNFPNPSRVYIRLCKHAVIFVIQSIWLVSYLGIRRYIHRVGRWIWNRKNRCREWVFCLSVIVKPFWKYTNIQVLMTFKARKDFMVFKQRDLLWSSLL